MKLVLIKAPNDYVHKGREVWVNPDYICSVTPEHDGALVKLWNGEGYMSQKSVMETVDDINFAMKPPLPPAPPGLLGPQL